MKIGRKIHVYDKGSEVWVYYRHYEGMELVKMEKVNDLSGKEVYRVTDKVVGRSKDFRKLDNARDMVYERLGVYSLGLLKFSVCESEGERYFEVCGGDVNKFG